MLSDRLPNAVSGRRAWLPKTVLAVGLILTVVITLLFAHSLDSKLRQRFDTDVEAARDNIQARMESYPTLLRGGAALYAVSHDVTRSDWQSYVERLRIRDLYPGLLGLGFSLRMRADETNRVSIRMEQEGIPGFHVWPDSARTEFHAITFLEPLDGPNATAVGYDMFTEPVRREAMEIARDSGTVATSGKVRLVQETKGAEQAGFLIYLPVYNGRRAPPEVAQRRADLYGFVYGAFRADDFFQALFGRGAPLNLQLSVYDGPAEPANLLHQSQYLPAGFKPHLQTHKSVRMANRDWTLVFASPPSYETSIGRAFIPMLPLFGTGLTLVLYYLTGAQARARIRAEFVAAELARQRERLRVTLFSIGDAVIATDASGAVEFMNRLAEEFSGWKLDEVRGRPLEQVFHVLEEDTRQPRENPVTALHRDKKSLPIVSQSLLVAKDGGERVINESAALIRDQAGRTIGLILVFHNVTEQKRAERRNSARNAVTTVLAEAASLSDAAPGLLEGICRSLRFDFGAFWNFDDEADEGRCVATWHRPDGSFENFQRATLEFRVRRGIGLPGRVWESGQPICITDLSSDANFPRAAAAARDHLESAFAFPIKLGPRVLGEMEFFSGKISCDDPELMELMAAMGSQIGQYLEPKRAEADLQASEELHRTISETASDAILMMNEQSIIVSVNRAAEQLFGYLAAEMIGQSMTMLMPERMRVRHRQGVEHFLKSGRRNIPWSGVELPGLHKDGHEIFLEVSFGSSTRNGKMVFTGFVRDITKRKETELALKSAQEELTQHAANLERKVAERTAKLREMVGELEAFSYSVSHDLRAPLRAMQGFSHVLLQDFAQKIGPEEREYLKRIVKASERMDRLIQDVLAYSRAGRTELKLQSVDPEKLIAEVIQHYPALQAPRAEISIERPLLRVIGHDASLTQCLSNLLTNAVKFVAPDVLPKIRIWSERRNDMVRLWIEDNGIGIAPHHQERIFGMFQRIHPDSRYEGTGIGLAIVNKAIQRMGGELGVESEEGKGSRFWLQLRAADS